MISRLFATLGLSLCAKSFAQIPVDSLATASQTVPTTSAPTSSPVSLVRAESWWDALGRDSLPSDSLQKIAMNIGILPGTDANGNTPARVLNSFSASVVASEAGAIRGVQLAGGMNEVHGSVRGLQATYGLDLVGGGMVGAQFGGVNLVRHDVRGFQYGYLFNKVGGDVRGWQLGVVGNVVSGDVHGLQTASIVNKARAVHGLQDGFLNLADRIRGAQGGFINIADNIKGIQWGFVNVADTMVGPQIGLVNIRPDARYFVETWFDETGLAHLSLNYGSPGWYNLIDLGMRGRGSQRASIGLGFGCRYPSRRLILSLDASASLVVNPHQLDDAQKDDDSLEITIRATDDSESDFRVEGDPDEIDAFNGLFKARATAGLSVFWKSPMGPIRFDFSQVLTKEDYDKTETFRFSTSTKF